MVEPNQKTFVLKEGWASQETREQQRLTALSELGLMQPETVPVFEEATQTAAHFLEAPISMLGFMDNERHWFKSAVGLSRLGLMNQLAQTRQLMRGESFCTQVVENSQPVVINDTRKHAQSELFASKLVNDYGVGAYLGAPLIDSQGNCLGTLAVMDLLPHNFTNRDVEFLQIIARWSMSEFERNRVLQSLPSVVKTVTPPVADSTGWSSSQSSTPPATADVKVKINPPVLPKNIDSTNKLKLQLLGQLTQELRTPLTSVLGMTSVLGREIYGPLTSKQREYLEIIQHSGRYLLSLVNEISELGAMDNISTTLNLTPVDIEMLCQQVINTLDEVANRREQNIRLSIEPGRNRIWALDKDKVKQILYHLVFSVVQLSATGSIVRIHVSYKEDFISITVRASHPWLGDGITEVDPYFRLKQTPVLEFIGEKPKYERNSRNSGQNRNLNASNFTDDFSFGSNSKLGLFGDVSPESNTANGSISRESLGLLLSSQLAEIHGGSITIQGSTESGNRYVLSLPLQMASTDSAKEDSDEI